MGLLQSNAVINSHDRGGPLLCPDVNGAPNAVALGDLHHSNSATTLDAAMFQSLETIREWIDGVVADNPLPVLDAGSDAEGGSDSGASSGSSGSSGTSGTSGTSGGASSGASGGTTSGGASDDAGNGATPGASSGGCAFHGASKTRGDGALAVLGALFFVVNRRRRAA